MSFVGEIEPFDQKFLDELDQMTKTEAIETVSKLLQMSIEARDRYEESMIAQYSEGAMRCFAIDSNNMIRFRKLLKEIEMED